MPTRTDTETTEPVKELQFKKYNLFNSLYFQLFIDKNVLSLKAFIATGMHLAQIRLHDLLMITVSQVGKAMVNHSASTNPDLDRLNCKVSQLKNRLKKLTSTEKPYANLDDLVESIKGQLDLEEKTMKKLGLSLTSVHQNEHKKLLGEISLLEFSWKAKRISDDVYIKALNYKLEFHDHYFDQAQRMLVIAGQK